MSAETLAPLIRRLQRIDATVEFGMDDAKFINALIDAYFLGKQAARMRAQRRRAARKAKP